MTQTREYALVSCLIDELRKVGSWTGETHIQKSAYVAKVVLNVPVEATFVIYKHGPYSFDLSAVLAGMRADGLINIVSQGTYGSTYLTTERTAKFLSKYGAEASRWRDKLATVAAELGPKRVAELERLATSIFIRLDKPSLSAKRRASELNLLKPHIPLTEAIEATQDADALSQRLEGFK